jgi:hypothetical protein
MTDSQRQILIARLRERADVMEPSDLIRPDDWQLLRDAALALAASPTVAQREQALDLASTCECAERGSFDRVQQARRLLGLAP